MRLPRPLHRLAAGFAFVSLLGSGPFAAANPPEPPPLPDPLDAALPNESLKLKDDPAIVFVTRGSKAEWEKLPAFWNDAADAQGKRVVKIKVPLGLSAPPAAPPENPMTVAKWELGKRLYYDKTLSSNGQVACATCHSPAKNFTDRRATSLGINDGLGGVNAPTVINSGYHRLQFWDGRAATLEEQAQGPVGNPLEMFSGKGDAWEEAIARLRRSPEYNRAFQGVFGHLPTRDAAAKAIATYERTVLSGNSIFDRADVLMRQRVAEEETGKFDFKAEDFAAALKAAFAAKDEYALAALGLDPAKDAAKADEAGQKLVNGRNLYFGKARCSNCHVGDNFTDNTFHNLGVGAKDGKLPLTDQGRWARLPTGHKDPAFYGAFKTPGLRALVGSQPYMHHGGEATLEEVVDFYDRGGNANEFLDPKMRDLDAEDAYLKAKSGGADYAGPKPALFTRGGRPIIPLQLKLTPGEKADLVMFLKALQGDPVPAVVADPAKFPEPMRVSRR